MTVMYFMCVILATIVFVYFEVPLCCTFCAIFVMLIVNSYFNEAQKLLKSPVHFLVCSFVVVVVVVVLYCFWKCHTVFDMVNVL